MADTDIVARGLASQALARVPVFTPEAYGAVGNGVTNDLTAVQAAFNAATTANVTIGGEQYWGRVRLTKRYNIGSGTITVTAPNAAVHGLIVEGFSPQACIIGTADQIGLNLVANSNASASWRQLHIEGLQMQGCGLQIDSGNSALFKVSGIKIDIKGVTGNAPTDGLTLKGPFEVGLYEPRIEWGSTTNQKSALYITNSVGQQASSIFIYNPNLHFGYHNLFADQYNNDIYVYGGTYLESQDSAINSAALIRLYGPHVEESCVASNNVGIEIYSGGGSIVDGAVGASVAAYPSGMKYLVGSYNGIDIRGGNMISDIAGAKIAFVDGNGDDYIFLSGNAAFDYDANAGITNYICNGLGGPTVLASGGSAQSITTATTTTLTLATLMVNMTGATVASNQVTVPAGQYLIEGRYNGRVGSSSAATIGATLQLYNNTGAAVVASNAKTLATPAGINESLYLEISAVVTLTVSTALSLRMVSTVSAGTLALSSDTGVPHYLTLTRIG